MWGEKRRRDIVMLQPENSLIIYSWLCVIELDIVSTVWLSWLTYALIIDAHEIFQLIHAHSLVIMQTLHSPCVSDDGKLSFEEFNAYFADGVLTTEELQELFYSIDGQQNKWVRIFFYHFKNVALNCLKALLMAVMYGEKKRNWTAGVGSFKAQYAKSKII